MNNEFPDEWSILQSLVTARRGKRDLTYVGRWFEGPPAPVTTDDVFALIDEELNAGE